MTAQPNAEPIAPSATVEAAAQPASSPQPSAASPLPIARGGPSTPEGKARCRLNAYRHGLTGQFMLFLPEEQAAYDAHCAGFKNHYRPYGVVEQNLVQSIADAQWRLRRATAFENSIFAMALAHVSQPSAAAAPPAANHPQVDAAFAQASTWLNQGSNLALLSLYEQRIQRKLEKDLNTLKAEQARRHAEYEANMAIAKNLLTYAKAMGQRYNPKEFFLTYPATIESVFSEAAVLHEITREQLREEAFHHHCYALPPAEPPEWEAV